MKYYIKYNENKKVTEFAPFNKGSISNYNSPTNAYILSQDGYEPHEIEKGHDGMYIKGHAPLPPEFDLQKAKEEKVNIIDAETIEKITTGFWYYDETIMETPLHFSYDSIDQSNFNSSMNGANFYLISVSLGMPPLAEDINWNGYTDIEHVNLVKVLFDAPQFIKFWGYSELYHKNAILEEARILKEYIKLATTEEEIKNITWGFVPEDTEKFPVDINETEQNIPVA